ncbi:MAG TPA: hypothetical protein VGO58_00130 [Chitinophagaceae bacterium]|jgi:hypothetical protein|nr:hypothetical protein [Chitinophagaceae bacterium]
MILLKRITIIIDLCFIVPAFCFAQQKDRSELSTTDIISAGKLDGTQISGMVEGYGGKNREIYRDYFIFFNLSFKSASEIVTASDLS